jgi:Tol biopolymer transport system component
VTPKGVDAYGARWLPDGESLVYQGRDATTLEIGNLFVVNVVTGETTQITDLEPAFYGDWFLSPEPSPDGRTVLFHMPRRTNGILRWDLWSIPVTGGEPTLERRNASVGVYAPTGEIAFLGAPRGFSSSTLVCRCTDGARLLAEGDAIAWPRWSPDGTRIVYADGGDIHILELATGVSSVVARGGSAEWFDDDTLVVVAAS